MSTAEFQGSKLGKVATWLVIGIVFIIAVKLAFALAKIVINVGFFALFTLGPLILIGWLVLKALRWFSRDSVDMSV